MASLPRLQSSSLFRPRTHARPTRPTIFPALCEAYTPNCSLRQTALKGKLTAAAARRVHRRYVTESTAVQRAPAVSEGPPARPVRRRQRGWPPSGAARDGRPAPRRWTGAVCRRQTRDTAAPAPGAHRPEIRLKKWVCAARQKDVLIQWKGRSLAMPRECETRARHSVAAGSAACVQTWNHLACLRAARASRHFCLSKTSGGSLEAVGSANEPAPHHTWSWVTVVRAR